MAYVKHPLYGNKHVDDSEVESLVKDGWVQWPRKMEEKILGDGSDAAYWRNKYARDMAEKTLAPEQEVKAEEVDSKPTRLGRPPKA